MQAIGEEKKSNPKKEVEEVESSESVEGQVTDSKPKKLPKVILNTSNARGEFRLI